MAKKINLVFTLAALVLVLILTASVSVGCLKKSNNKTNLPEVNSNLNTNQELLNAGDDTAGLNDSGPVDINKEINDADSAINSIDSSDFNSDALSEKELGI